MINQIVNEVMICLTDIGFPLINIRKALHKIVGITQPIINTLIRFTAAIPLLDGE